MTPLDLQQPPRGVLLLRVGPECLLFVGAPPRRPDLILLSAAGVKISERKNAAAARHAVRAAALRRELIKVRDSTIERALEVSPATLAEHAEAATRIPAELRATAPGQPQSVFSFILGPILT